MYIILCGLLVIALLTSCPGSMPQHCCPKIKAFKVSDPWVCPERCPNGGKTRISYEVEFWKENELCIPPKEFTISIRNVTDDVDLEPLKLDNPKLGVYSGTKEVSVKRDTEYKLTAKLDDQVCAEVSESLKVYVINGDKKHDYKSICISGKAALPDCVPKGGFVPFGPGVLIDYVYNASSFKVRVDKDSKSDFIVPYGNGYGFQGLEAADEWSIALTTETDCSLYFNLPQDKQKLCVDVYLKCNCP